MNSPPAASSKPTPSKALTNADITQDYHALNLKRIFTRITIWPLKNNKTRLIYQPSTPKKILNERSQNIPRPLISLERPSRQPAPLTRNTQIADLAGGVAKAKTTDILIVFRAPAAYKDRFVVPTAPQNLPQCINKSGREKYKQNRKHNRHILHNLSLGRIHARRLWV